MTSPKNTMRVKGQPIFDMPAKPGQLADSDQAKDPSYYKDRVSDLTKQKRRIFNPKSDYETYEYTKKPKAATSIGAKVALPVK